MLNLRRHPKKGRTLNSQGLLPFRQIVKAGRHHAGLKKVNEMLRDPSPDKCPMGRYRDMIIEDNPEIVLGRKKGLEK